MAQVFELMMLLCFGVSWPISAIKSWRAQANGPKSLLFVSAIWVGYVCGIASKVIAGNLTYVVWFYIINLCWVSVDIAVYFRNRRLEKARLLAEAP